MFTGIVEEVGKIDRLQDYRLSVEGPKVLEGTKLGDSIAVNGACLTVVKLSGKKFEVDLSPETLAASTFNTAKLWDRLNLERAMRLSDRIDGHLVSGHIDGIGVIKKKQKLGNAVIITIAVPEALLRYMIHKGSIAVDGISLTINACESKSVLVSIIPHTAEITTIGLKQNGDPVNIETDMIGKYVERFTQGDSTHSSEETTTSSGVTMESLAKSGFL